MRKDNGIAFALVDIGHSLTIDGHKLLLGEGRVAQVHRYDPLNFWGFRPRSIRSLPSRLMEVVASGHASVGEILGRFAA